MSRGGRPKVGGARVLVIMSDDLLARVDRHASERGLSRSAAVRDLVAIATGQIDLEREFQRVFRRLRSGPESAD